MKKIILVSFLFIISIVPLFAQQNHEHNHDYRKIVFPDVPGYFTLSTDLHMHTVFSDGSVWPDIRLQEANRDDIDAVAFTEHLEYQPHDEDIPHPDRNRSYEVAKESLPGDSDLMIINGSEITRDMPPGHTNAIFIEDANKLLNDDVKAVFREANRQGAFVFWNHPNWTEQRKDGIAALFDLHKELIGEGLLHGIEVVNDVTYSEEALQIALDNDLTILGTSDIHGLVDWQFDVHHDGHRPVTLVLAENRDKESLKEGLKDGRTVVWFNDILIGKEENIVPLIEASLSLSEVSYDGDTTVLNVTITNHSSAKYLLRNKSNYTFHQHSDVITIEPLSTEILQVKTVSEIESLQLPFEIMNAVTAPDEHPIITFDVGIM